MISRTITRARSHTWSTKCSFTAEILVRDRAAPTEKGSFRVLYMPPTLRPDAGVGLETVTIEWVKANSADLWRYCALHRCWHHKDEFSSVQQENGIRICLRANPHEWALFRADSGTVINMVPSEQGKRDICRILKRRVVGQEAHREYDAGPRQTKRQTKAPERLADETSARAERLADVAGQAKGLHGTSEYAGRTSDAAVRRMRERAWMPVPYGTGVRSVYWARITSVSDDGRTIGVRYDDGEEAQLDRSDIPSFARSKRRIRKGGGAQLVSALGSWAAQRKRLEVLREKQVVKAVRKRALRLTLGLVEYLTDVCSLVKPGSLVCGQAALVAATGLQLRELGIRPLPITSTPGANILSMSGLNNQLESSDAAGRAFVLRQPLQPVGDAHEVFGRRTGIFMLLAYHAPDDEHAREPMPYGTEVLGCRCAHTPPSSSPPHALLLPTPRPPPPHPTRELPVLTSRPHAPRRRGPPPNAQRSGTCGHALGGAATPALEARAPHPSARPPSRRLPRLTVCRAANTGSASSSSTATALPGTQAQSRTTTRPRRNISSSSMTAMLDGTTSLSRRR